MLGIILGKHFTIGSREVYEDRVAVEEFITAAGLHLAVGIVADGVGGQDKGERAAQLTIDLVMRYLRNSREEDVSSLLTTALRYANQNVYDEAQIPGNEGMCTTAAIAAIVNRKTLYIANVGDSRIYLWRNQRVTQLSVDHTFATLLVQKDGKSRSEADQHPRAHVVTRAIGLQQAMQVDIGFYAGIEDPALAAERGYQGLPLREGDSILVCSDGLVKDSPRTGEPLIAESEIISVLGHEEGDKAARTLVAFALGRDPDDNISVALLQMPDPARLGRKTRRQRAQQIGIVGAILVLILGLVVAISRLVQTSGRLSTVANEATRTSFEETSIAQTVAAYTPTPIPATATLRPVPIVGEIAALFSKGERLPLTAGQLLTIDSDPALIVVNHREDLTDGDDGHIYILPNATIALDSVTDDRFSVTVLKGSQLFIQTGRYIGGASIRIEPSGISVTAKDACMALSLPDPKDIQTIAVACYQGTCSYALHFGEALLPIGEGKQITLDQERIEASGLSAIPQAQAIGYSAILGGSGSTGRTDIQTCLGPYLPPPPSITPGGNVPPGSESPLDQTASSVLAETNIATTATKQPDTTTSVSTDSTTPIPSTP